MPIHIVLLIAVSSGDSMPMKLAGLGSSSAIYSSSSWMSILVLISKRDDLFLYNAAPHTTLART
jgi:hypothetical protein